MPDDLAAMQTALRVLAAHTECIPADPADVEALRLIAQKADAPLDEIACDLIQAALRSREKARGLAHTMLARVRAAAREEWQAGTTPRTQAGKETGPHEPKSRSMAS
jgi:hypothetical protein